MWLMWLFFPVLHVLWLRRPQEMSLTSPWHIRIQTFVLLHHETYELSFSSKCAFCLGTSRQRQEAESRFTERIGNTHNIYVSDQGKLFFTRSCTLLLTLLQHCAPSFAQNRFVMYITHVHRYVCYVFHLIMYKISFLCWLGQSLSMFATITWRYVHVDVIYITLCSFVCTNRFVMYLTHVHRYVCYVFHLIMYKISFLCWLGLQ